MRDESREYSETIPTEVKTGFAKDFIQGIFDENLTGFQLKNGVITFNGAKVFPWYANDGKYSEYDEQTFAEALRTLGLQSNRHGQCAKLDTPELAKLAAVGIKFPGSEAMKMHMQQALPTTEIQDGPASVVGWSPDRGAHL